jgi:hypothetical protein
LHFPSPFLDPTFCDDICYRIRNITDIGDMKVTDLRFGGQNSHPQSILFTISRGDVLLHPMLEKQKNWTEILIMDQAALSFLGADLRAPQYGEDPGLSRMRSDAMNRVFVWINETCIHTCVHGSCLLQVCRCELSFTGSNCTTDMTE